MSPAANPFGLDVSWLDVPAFIATSQAVYALVAILWLLLALRLRRPGLLFAGVLAGNAAFCFEPQGCGSDVDQSLPESPARAGGRGPSFALQPQGRC